MNVLCKENPPQNTCIFLNEILGNLLKICLMTAERQNCSQKAILYFLFKSDASNLCHIYHRITVWHSKTGDFFDEILFCLSLL